jgi:hypothetical protein
METQDLKLMMKLLSAKINENLENIKYRGDISDLGNEVGYCVGKVLSMNEQDTNDFIIGIRHGISLTNGTH